MIFEIHEPCLGIMFPEIRDLPVSEVTWRDGTGNQRIGVGVGRGSGSGSGSCFGQGSGEEIWQGDLARRAVLDAWLQ